MSAVEESEQTTTDVEAEKDVENVIEDEEGCQIGFAAADQKGAATNQIPILIDNKRKHLEQNQSAAQRDHLMMNEAKEKRELRKDLGNAIRDSSSSYNEGIQSISGCITEFAESITKSMEMLSHAMINSQHIQPQSVNQNLFYPPQK